MKNYYLKWYSRKPLYGVFLAILCLCCTLDLSAETCPYNVTTTVNNVSCGNANDGSITLNIVGAVNPTFLWSTGDTSQNLTGLAPGTYSVDINDNNCIQNGSFTVGQTDNIPPVAICKDVVIQLGLSGTINITPNYLNNGSHDNCGIPTLTISKSTFTCADLGWNQVILTVTDAAGNVATCTGNVLVQDLLPPVASCNSMSIFLDANGNATLTANQVNNNSYDNCGIETITIDKTNFTCADLGANTVTLTVTDSSGNVATCTATITVVNNIPPTAVCQNVDVYLDVNGNASISAFEVNNGSSAACGGSISVNLNKTDFNCSNIGANTVTLTVTDQWGNSSNCTATVHVFDTIAPQVTCPADMTVNLTSGCTKYIVLPSPTIFEACGGTAMVVMTDNPNILIGLTPSGSYAGAFPLGTTNVIYKVDDGLGNWEMCNFNITVNDLLPPTINNLPANFTVTNTQGLCEATVTWATPTASDNCPNVTLVSSHNSGDVFAVGTTNVVYTATDAAGNTTVDSFKVTVQDTEAPTVYCKISAALPGTVITIADVYAGSSDNCGVDLSTLSLTLSGPLTCSGLGQVAYTLTVEDIHGNIGSCSGSINVVDNLPPVANCKDVTAYLDANGNANITPAMVNNGSTDNCGIASMTLDKTLFNCSHIGTQSVTLTVTDFSGNTSNCNALVFVQDTTAPTLTTQNTTVYLDANGTATINNNDVIANRSDNCSINKIQVIRRNFKCNHLGTNTVTVIVTDLSGNTTTKTAIVTVLDTIAPTVQCKNTTVYLDNNGRAKITNSDVIQADADNCAVVKRTISRRNFNCTAIGQNPVTITVEDKSGNTASCTAIVTVVDTISPKAVCKNITVMLDLNGQAIITAAEIDGGSTDNCAIKTLTASKTTFDCSNIGDNTVNLTVTDKSGNISVCQAIVTVVDMVFPTAKCQDATVYLNANGQALVNPNMINNGSFDNCGIASMTVTPNTFDCSNIGANTVTLTVTDINGNASICQATLNVIDDLYPVANCKNATLTLDANGNATVSTADINNGSTDNCGIVSMSVSPNTFDCSNLGTNQVTLTVTDAAGNSSTCTANVTVKDDIAPTVTCNSIMLFLDQNGQVTVNQNNLIWSMDDNCGVTNVTLGQTVFTCADLGVNMVNVTVADAAGNTATCQAMVKIKESFPPTAIAKNATVYLDANGQITLTSADIDNGSTDNCGILSMTVAPNTFDCSNIGANQVTLTVMDNFGNTAAANAIVTVLDTLAPVANCKNATVTLDANGQATITTADINNGSTDNCGIVSMTISPNTFDCSNVGANQVTLTVTDAAGNSSTCTSTVTVLGGGQPTLQCKNATVFLNANGQVTLTSADVVQSSTGGCGSATTISITPNTFDCSQTGTHIVTVTATDANGGTATCTANVTVEDNTAPVANCKNATVYLDANGIATVSTSDINNGSSDNCGIASMTVSPNNFNCFQKGPNTVILTVTDAAGNSSTCTSTVTVVDNINPVANCKNATVTLDINGQATITAADVNNGSTDNCEISMTVSPNTFDCSNIGANQVTLTVTDAAGNSSTCTATVTVLGGGQPNVQCKNATVFLNANGQVTLTSADVVQSSTGGCGSATTITIAPNTFDCSQTGTHTVTVTATDANGATATCTATVTVSDNTNPVANCKDATVTLDANGQATITTADVNNGSTDNCGIVSMTVSPNTFDCSNIGANQVTLTVTDAAGNSSTCTAKVTVLGGGQPTVQCKNATVFLNANGQVTLTSADVVQSSTGGCGSSTTISIAPNTFNCTQTGTHTVTVTATDANGATATCTATVTVKDNTNPVANCKNATVTLDANGQATITTADINNGSTDNCGIVSMMVSPNTFDCSNVGVNTVTLTVTDAAGNTSTCTSIVTIPSSVTGTITSTPVTCNELKICKDGTPSSASYTVALHGTPGSIAYKSTTTNPLTLIQYGDGTARIRGEIYNTADATKRWEVDVYLNQKMDLATYQTTYNGTPWSQSGDPVSTWDYYIMDASKSNKMFGKGSFAGKVMDLTHQPTNLTKAFQVGDGASLYRANSSLSGWFYFSNAYNGTGDFDFDLQGCQVVQGAKETCEDGTPSSANYALVLHGNSNGTTKYKSNPNNPLVLMRQADGSATITGEIQDITNSNKKWSVDVNLYQKMDLTTYQNTYSGTAWSQSGDPVSTWDYYIMDATATNTFTGLGALAGQSINLTHQPTNLTKAFQVGDAASLYRTNPSLAGWFYFAGSDAGTGDFDFDLTNCVLDTAACNGTATVAVTGLGSSTSCGVVAEWNIATCSANTSYSEFTPTIPNGACMNVNASNFTRGSNSHSCNYGRPNGDGVGVCSDGFTSSSFVSGSSKAFVFDMTIPANTNGRVSQLNFWELSSSQIQFLTTGNNVYSNNNPTKYGVRVLKNGLEIFKQIDIPTTSNWSLEQFAFTGTNFDYTGGENFKFELFAYAPAGILNCSYNGIWDIDEISVEACCGNGNNCGGIPPVTTTGGTTTVDWDVATCTANSSYSEFTPTVSGNACVNVTAANLTRGSGGHSCNYGRPNGDGVGVCADGFTGSSFVSGASNAFVFEVTIPASSNGTLSKMSFWELSSSQIQFLTTGNNYYSNNNPTKYGVRVLKNGLEIFKQIDIPTTSSWSLEDFNFSGAAFDYSGGEVFKFELLAYAPAGLWFTSYNGIWDIDEVSVTLNCAAVPTTPLGYSYLWSNGATTPSISGLCAGDYTVSVTDGNNNNVYTGTVNVGDSSVNCTPVTPTPTCNVTCSTGELTTFEYDAGNGTAVSTVLNHASFPNNPYNVHYISDLTQNDVAEYHGIWTRGYIIPTVTGLYDIYLSSDDNGQLWLSSDCDSTNKALVGEVTGWTNYKEWTKYAAQKTANIYLEAGKPYYFEMVMKNHGGPGHWSIGWVQPSSTAIEVIEGKYVANYKCSTCTNTTNLALNKPSSQSSTCNSAPASRANDGNTNGNFNSGSVSHTCYNTNPYWELDLQGVHEIDEIKIWNRTDCCGSRLSNYYVFVSNVPFTSANITTLKNDPNNWWNYQTVQAGSPTVLSVGRTGRYVCVMMNGTNYLHLAEVEVMGCGINNVILSQANPNAVNTVFNPILPIEDAETPEYFEVNAYPNPFNDRLTLEAFVPTNEEFLSVRIMDMNGKVVYTNNQIGTTGEVIEDLDVPNLANGIYILEARTANQVKTVKLVKVGRP